VGQPARDKFGLQAGCLRALQRQRQDFSPAAAPDQAGLAGARCSVGLRRQAGDHRATGEGTRHRCSALARAPPATRSFRARRPGWGRLRVGLRAARAAGVLETPAVVSTRAPPQAIPERTAAGRPWPPGGYGAAKAVEEGLRGAGRDHTRRTIDAPGDAARVRSRVIFPVTYTRSATRARPRRPSFASTTAWSGEIVQK